jgi:hypothetical protein
MEKEFMSGINELHEYDNENSMISTALEDAEYQLIQDNNDANEIFVEVSEYLNEIEEDNLKLEEEEKNAAWVEFVRKVGGSNTFDIIDQIDELGSPKVVRRHQENYESKIKEEEETLQKAWDGIDSEMSEEEILLRMLGIVGDDENEWNDEFEIGSVDSWGEEDDKNDEVYDDLNEEWLLAGDEEEMYNIGRRK